MGMELTFTYDSKTPPDFSASDLEDILDGAAILDDITRYRNARRQFLHDQELIEKWVTQTAPTLAREHLHKTIDTLWDDPPDTGDDGTVLDGDGVMLDGNDEPEPDPHAALDRVIAAVDAIKAQVAERTTGPHAQKLERRYEALVEVYDGLKTRVLSYKGNLPTQRALAVLFTDDDDDAQSAQGVAPPAQTATS